MKSSSHFTNTQQSLTHTQAPAFLHQGESIHPNSNHYTQSSFLTMFALGIPSRPMVLLLLVEATCEIEPKIPLILLGLDNEK